MPSTARRARTLGLTAFVLFLACAMLPVSEALAQNTRPLQHDDVNQWNHITSRMISDNGDWAMWQVGPPEGDATLHVRHTARQTHHVVARGESAQFSGDGSHVIFRLKAPFDSTRQAKLDEKKKDEMPPDSVGFLNLQTGALSILDPIQSFKVPEKGGSRFAYLLTDAASKPDSADADSVGMTPEEPEEESAEAGESDSSEVDTPDIPDTATLVVHDLADGSSMRVEGVAEYTFSEDGNGLAVSVYADEETPEEHGVYVIGSRDDGPTPLLTGEGRYLHLAFDKSGVQLAFLSDRDDWPAENPATDLYLAQPGETFAQKVLDARHTRLPSGWWISEHGDVVFSDDGTRLFFGSAPEPESEPEDEPELLDNETVEVDVWSWTDPLLQPMQLVQADREKKRTHAAVLHLDQRRRGDDAVVQLASKDIPDVTYADGRHGDVVLGETDMPYRQRISWDSPRYQDAYTINITSGERTKLFTDRQVNTSLSPAGRYVYWWDGHAKHWFAWDVRRGLEINLTADLGVSMADHLADRPMIPGPEGSAGWTDDDALFLVYDKHDVWAIDPARPGNARMITEGFGRLQDVRFRVVDLDREDPAVSNDLVLSSFDFGTKERGYYADQVRGDGQPRELIGGPHAYGNLAKAENADQVIFSRQSFREYPDVWTADLSLSSPQKLSGANPQLDQFSWGTAELVRWTSLDGDELDGILYKPDGFDATQKYPMMVYFYEKSSSGLFNHFAPRASRSSIDRSFYVSRGYLLFVPDIPYKDGYPGESAMNAVMPGITALIDEGFVDADRIGVQGHSWGGYQIAYMVTQTNLFAAAEAGAPVSNMTSAYGGIRWASGMSRMFQYEKTQSRIGGTLWDAQHRYIDNSPLFQADKVQTPLLMMHNDEDGAVPWYQGIEYFVALRRLGTPVWMLNYNGEAHGLRNLHNQRDWAIRMQQFFDHYLMDAPAPVWMTEGVPAVKKGETLGLELGE